MKHQHIPDNSSIQLFDKFANQKNYLFLSDYFCLGAVNPSY